MVLLLGGGLAVVLLGSSRPAPLKLAPGWRIELVVQAPDILFPTAIVAAPDGTIYLGQDPMDMPGPPTEPADSVVAIRDGKVTRFADGLHAVMGLEWVDGTLYVVHAPFLSALRDTDGDGRADERVDLVRGLGPEVPAFNGINDHIASGIRLGLDGYLYIAVGDKGIPRAVGRDGTTLRMRGGGVIRVRPDGTGLEVVSTGERNPLSVALSDTDEIFTYGNDDDSKRWPNSLTHHIVGGHYGYPYEFAEAPGRALPILDGTIGGAGAQGLCYNEVGLGRRFRGHLFFCDWGRGAVVRYEVERAGGSFRVKDREYVVRKGTMRDFRPFSIAVGDRGRCLYLVDWAFNGFLVAGPRTGRLFRLTYADDAGDEPTAGIDDDPLARLDHPARAVRIEAQRTLAGQGTRAEGALIERLGRHDHGPGRVHALWALSMIDTPSARRAIRAAFGDGDVDVRAQAARSTGIRRDRESRSGLAGLLRDPSALVRREAAIALGRLGDADAGPPLMAALGDSDAFADWSIRQAIRTIAAWDVEAVRVALRDPRRRESALALGDEAWALPVVEALTLALEDAGEPAWRARVVATLAGLYRTYPEWSGYWWGPDPLAGELPRKTREWDLAGMSGVLAGLSSCVDDPEASVRRQAILGLAGAGKAATHSLRRALDSEREAANLVLVVRALGELHDAASAPGLVRLLRNAGASGEVREAALAALEQVQAPEAVGARLAVVGDREAPAALVARAIQGFAQDRRLGTDELSGFLGHREASVRAAALGALAERDVRAPAVRGSIAARLDDGSPAVRLAAIRAVGALRIAEGAPRLGPLAEDRDARLEAIRALGLLADPGAAPAFLSAIEDRDPEVRLAGERGLRAIRETAQGELASYRESRRLPASAEEILGRALARFEPVREWRVIGPFPRNTPRLGADPSAIDFERALVGVDGRVVRWATRLAEPSTGRVTLDDLREGPARRGDHGYDPGHSPDLLACGYADLDAPDERAAWMRIGSSGTISVELNGLRVFHADHSSGRAYTPDSDTAPVRLRAGANRIVVRSREGIGSWSFGLQVSAAEAGSPSPPASPHAADRNLMDDAMAHAGDARRGESLFFEAGGVGCARCHSAGGRGIAGIGPDLTGLALKYDRAEIVRSVLEPSSRIVNGYRPVVVATDDGTVASGLLRAETDDHLELVDPEGKAVRVEKSAIVARRLGETSPMPTGLVDGLTPREFADLVAFLESLR